MQSAVALENFSDIPDPSYPCAAIIRSCSAVVSLADRLGQQFNHQRFDPRAHAASL
jgi:hypothetical protein